ncbi:Zn-dependent hydrolase [Dactylosporangium sp. NPDC000555]|uniref:Zn-dependent hydrolase n=1 Tax=Dactylosporangium sp. NPDC000555 TaxID=3154260 RepID=UPI00332F9032
MKTLVRPDNIDRLIARFAEISEGGPGVTRLAYSPLEREAHAVFAEEMTRLGATVTGDAVGNSIAELPPTTGGQMAAIGTGSHLDSVPVGGRFDGIAGVCAGIEVARAVVEAGLERNRPWRIVAFAAEEGARFGQACNGSRAVAGLSTPEGLAALHDKNGVTLAEAMRSLGLAPERCREATWDRADWCAFVELHIEQGNLLESSGLPIGVVDVISGSSRLLVRIEGTASHTGGTPMYLRRDALAAAAECVLVCERIAGDSRHRGTRVTVGRLEVQPGSVTTIPGEVVFSVDVRDLDNARQRETVEELIGRFGGIVERRRVRLVVERTGDTSPVMLPSWLAGEIVSAAGAEGYAYRVMSSGASHDSQQVNRIAPTGMIFVPSRDGLSHVPQEWTTSEELSAGAAVLLATLLRLDARSEAAR